MKILIHDYAGHPFQAALSRELARRGHDVVHAFFFGDKGPKGDFQARSSDFNLKFSALSIATPYDKASLIRRRFGDVAYGRVAARLIAAEKPDLVLSGNTPTEAQSFIVQACKNNASAFVYWVQDFYSVAVSALLARRLGRVGSAIGAYYRMLERRQMRLADGIVTVTKDFEELSMRWGGENDKVTTIENWGLVNDISPILKDNAWSSPLGLSGTFNFVYSGTLGLKHNPMLLVELARAMRARARVVVVSEGVGVDLLRRHKEAEGLDNLMIVPLQPFENLKSVLGTADVAVAIIEPEAGIFSVPSKVQSYLCAARPVLLAAPGANLASKVVNRENAGLVVDPADIAGFTRAAEWLFDNPDARAELGANGRAYADLNFDISRVADRFMDVFSRAMLRRSSSL